ncbi:MAG: hypothetical protein AAFU85_24395 [Planctomycetota bacterium]
MTKLSPKTLERLRPLEKQLRAAVGKGALEEAIELTGQIQSLFTNREHHRLLKAKLWVFEAALDANRLSYAESGFRGVRKLSNSGTRLHLEASALLGVCLLRQQDTPEAKKLFRGVIKSINDISSDRTRRQFQKRLIERIEEECILSELIGAGEARLDVSEMHEQAVLLIRRNSDNEILKLIGNSVPSSGIKLLHDVRDYSIKLLPAPDRKLLPASEEAERPLVVGKKTAAVLKRIAWKSLCDPESELYRLWSKQVPKVFNETYFTGSLAATLASWRIGLPILGAGIAAVAMKSTAEAFCDYAKPKGLMIDRSEKDEE